MDLRKHLGLTSALACLLAAALSASAQDPSDQKSTVTTRPPATPAPASSLPSMPAPVVVKPEPVYTDPLLQPIIVAPGAAQPMPSTQQPKSATADTVASLPPYDPNGARMLRDHLGSTYIPVDSPVYPMALRLYSLGYLNTSFITMRPWTRRALLHALEDSRSDIVSDGDQQALEIFTKLEAAIAEEDPGNKLYRGSVYGAETLYARLMGIDGPILRDSYHLGQTIVNDYGRPYQAGFNSLLGFSSVNEHGRFSLYVRGEYEHSPSATGYNYALSSFLSALDQIPYTGSNLNQATIPAGPIAAQNPFRLQQATLSFHLLGHEISGGKSDAWVGPGAGGGMAWSNNAEDIYSFRVNRVEPMRIPLLHYITGNLRYDFFVGSLKGHSYPNSPWIHSETIEIHPTRNVQIGFVRSVIWGGEGHEAITLHTFLRSFFSFDDTGQDSAEKAGNTDPGARFSAFNFSWRLPYLTHWVTLYTDSIVHDDVTPPSAPRRAAYRPGVYIAKFPHLLRLDFRIEASNTDTSTTRSTLGAFNYYETIQKQGYTNKGFIMGDWVGRQAKAGQAWLTYHLSGNEWVQLEYLYKKTPNGFIAGGTSQGQVQLNVNKRIHKDIELNAWYQFERWEAPIYMTGPQKNSTFTAQVTWYPKLRTIPGTKQGRW